MRSAVRCVFVCGALTFAAIDTAAQETAADPFAAALRAGHVRVLGEGVRTHGADVDSVAFSRDGRHALSTGADGVIVVWDARTGERLKSMDADRAIHFAVFAGDEIVALEGDGKLRFRSRATGEVVATVDGIDATVAAVAGNVTALEGAVSPDEAELVFASPGGRSFIRIDLAARKWIEPIPARFGIAKAIAYTPDARHLVLGEVKGLAGVVTVWDRKAGKAVHSKRAERMTRIAVTGDSKAFVVASGRSFDVRSVTDGESCATLAGMSDPVTCLALDETGKRMWFGTALDSAVVCVDIESERLAYSIGEHVRSVRSLALSPDGARLLTGSADCTLRFWSTADGRQAHLPNGNVNRIDSLVFSADGSAIASGDYSSRVVVSDVQGEVVRVLGEHDGSVVGVTYGEDGAVLSAGSDNAIRLWKPGGGELRRVAIDDETPMSLFALSPTRHVAVCGYFGPHARLFDARSWKPTHVLRHVGTDLSIQSVAFTPDGSLVATGDSDGTVRVWRVATGEAVARLRCRGTWISALAFVDGVSLAVGDGAGRLRLWRVGEKSRPSDRALGEDVSVHAITVAPDRTRYAVATGKAVHVFDAESGDPAGRIDAYPGTISTMAFGPKGRMLAAGMFDGTILVWDLSKLPLRTK